MPLRSTGMPVARTAHTVKSAVNWISGATKISPNGTANSRNSSGKASEPARRGPNSASAATGNIATNVVLRHDLHLAQLRPPASRRRAGPGSSSAGGQGCGGYRLKSRAGARRATG